MVGGTCAASAFGRAFPQFRGPAWVLVLVVGLLLSGCESLREPPSFGWLPEQRPPPRVWTLDGRVGVKMDGRGWSARLHWRQSGRAFSARLSGPFGQGAVQVEKDARGVRLLESSGREHRGEALERWALEHLGAPLPVEELPYWLIGLPQPGKSSSIQRDPQGLIAHMDQAGWQVAFLGWQRVGDRILPRRLSLVRGEVSLSLVVHDWTEG
jgi:outer membrane lipoprotein LolB